MTIVIVQPNSYAEIVFSKEKLDELCKHHKPWKSVLFLDLIDSDIKNRFTF